MNSWRIFVTGGGGYLGRALLQELSRSHDLEIVALDRSGSLAMAHSDARIRIVRGDLLAPETYATELAGCDCVLHLAAATGKASQESQDRNTAAATESLLDACRGAGVEKFLFVSSIAAAFPEKRGYPYAIAKERAERAVMASGLRFAILRPTIILGAGAPVLASLATLARLPVMLVPGHGRVLVQPIAVQDVVHAITAILRRDMFRGETFEVGGPERLSIENLLQRLRIARTKRRGPVVHLPLPLIQGPLRLAERLGLGPILPATAGQFSSFRDDGTATDNPLQRAIAPDLTPLDQMLPIPRDAATDDVERECLVFTRHLLGHRPDPMVVDRYRRAVETMPALRPASDWERAVLGLARRGTLVTRSADVYAAIFAPASAIRKRLVLLLAILEVHPQHAGAIDKTLGGPVPIVILRVGVKAFASLLFLAGGILCFAPLRLLLVRRDKAAA